MLNRLLNEMRAMAGLSLLEGATQKDMTGKHVMQVSRSGTQVEIGVDEGPNTRLRPEVQARWFKVLMRLDNLSIRSPAVRKVTGGKGSPNAYGSGGGNSNGLFPLSATQERQLIAADRKEAEKRAEKERQRLEKEKRIRASSGHFRANVCPHCGTVCYGDCQANESVR